MYTYICVYDYVYVCAYTRQHVTMYQMNCICIYSRYACMYYVYRNTLIQCIVVSVQWYSTNCTVHEYRSIVSACIKHMKISIYKYIHVCISIYIYRYRYIYVCKCIWEFLPVCKCTCEFLPACTYKYINIHIYTACTRSEKPSQETDILKSQLANKIVIQHDNKANVWEFVTCATSTKSEKEPWRSAFCSTAWKNANSPKNAPASIVLRVWPLCTARKRPSSTKYSVLDWSSLWNTASPGCSTRRVMRWKHICRACSPVDESEYTCEEMWMSRVMRVHESSHKFEAHLDAWRVMRWTQTCRACLPVDESCHTCKARVDESCHTCTWVMSHTWCALFQCGAVRYSVLFSRESSP